MVTRIDLKKNELQFENRNFNKKHRESIKQVSEGGRGKIDKREKPITDWPVAK